MAFLTHMSGASTGIVELTGPLSLFVLWVSSYDGVSPNGQVLYTSLASYLLISPWSKQVMRSSTEAAWELVQVPGCMLPWGPLTGQSVVLTSIV